MSEEKYNIIFAGEVIRGMDPEVAKKNFSDAFKVTGMRLDALFSGKAVALKKGVDYREGMMFRAQLKKLGLLSSLNPLEGTEELQTSSSSSSGLNNTLGAPSNEMPAVANDSEPDDDWSLAPLGSDMNQIKDNRPLVSVDISKISVAPVGADILVEKPKRPVVSIDTSGISLSPEKPQ